MTELKPRNILAAKEHIERKKIGQDEQDLQDRLTTAPTRRRDICLSQRDCVIQPRVVPSAGLPWVTSFIIFSNPNGVAGEDE
jgi:hypothetical protein